MILSKWFYYALIAVLLLSLIVYVNYAASFLLPTMIGLSITFSIFIVFFDLREELEWKKVRDRVRRKIGRQLGSIISDIVMLCEIDAEPTVSEPTEEYFKKLSENQLNKLVSEKVKLTDAWKDPKLSSSMSDMFEKREILISEIEGRYGKFLDSELQNSLLDIEEYLHRLSFELIPIGPESEREKSISDLIVKIAKEIAQLRRRRIDLDF